MIKLATWNVNSIKVRLPQVLDWLEETGTDILALQETKVVDDQFPQQAFQERGYAVCFNGQKTYNGVAIISRDQACDRLDSLPGLNDEARRFLAVTIKGIRLINVYIPNGAAVDSDKYPYKLAWLEQLIAYLKTELLRYPKLAVVGDFNIAPEDRDVHDPQLWEGSVLVSQPVRQAFKAMLDLSLKDSFRLFEQHGSPYSWWDYRGGSFRRNNGLRIDHILLSEALSQDCAEVEIDVNPRRVDRPSDHTPVICHLRT